MRRSIAILSNCHTADIRLRALPEKPRGGISPPMSTLAEIEAALDALPKPQQEELLRHLAARLQRPAPSERQLPLVAATGSPITQQEIDDALDAD